MRWVAAMESRTRARSNWSKPGPGLIGFPLAYVADNPLKDFVTPRARGWWTVQVERPERVHHVRGAGRRP